jgi:predicted TIM-barrel fold metal-dependent hydrolase
MNSFERPGRRANCGCAAVCLLALAAWAAAAAAAEPAAGSCEPGEFRQMDKIDAHVHLHGALPLFLAQARADGFRLLTINVNYGDFAPLADQLREAITLRSASPGRVEFAATFDASGSEAPGWTVATQRQLDAALAQGAVAVKVWKDIGMQLRDSDGRAVMIDDARFEPIFANLAERGVVVLGHQGEPRNAWLPLGDMTIRGDREYFADHPQYHMFSHPEWPSYEQQLAARDRLLELHPRLRYVGVHLASLEWNVGRLSDFLAQHPQVYVDLAARLSHLQLQSVTDREHVREFFLRFQDRILYGTDLTRSPEASDAGFAEEAQEVWTTDWRYLACDDAMTSTEFPGTFRGLALPRPVLAKIYGSNARRLFPGAWRSG